MDLWLILKAVLSLSFVLGLLFLTLFLVKYCQANLLKNPLMKKVKKESRIEVLESKKLDAKNTLMLVRCDKEEHFLLLSPGHNLEIDRVKKK